MEALKNTAAYSLYLELNKLGYGVTLTKVKDTEFGSERFFLAVACIATTNENLLEMAKIASYYSMPSRLSYSSKSKRFKCYFAKPYISAEFVSNEMIDISRNQNIISEQELIHLNKEIHKI